MIHEVSGCAYGDVSSMENQVKAMRKFNDVIVNFYAKETGLSNTVIGNMMKAETWMSAEDAKKNGFVKNVGPTAKITNSIKAEHWQFNNMAMFNKYNSFTNNSNDMTLPKSISDAITAGFNSLVEKLGINNKTNEEEVKTALNGFTTSITDAFKDVEIPTNESITALVNTAITEGLKNISENEAFKNAITASTKNSITKEDLDTAINKLTNSLIEKIGNNTPAGAQKPRNENEPKRVKNRFSGKYSWE